LLLRAHLFGRQQIPGAASLPLSRDH
jgi:hypothetical protein